MTGKQTISAAIGSHPAKRVSGNTRTLLPRSHRQLPDIGEGFYGRPTSDFERARRVTRFSDHSQRISCDASCPGRPEDSNSKVEPCSQRKSTTIPRHGTDESEVAELIFVSGLLKSDGSGIDDIRTEFERALFIHRTRLTRLASIRIVCGPRNIPRPVLPTLPGYGLPRSRLPLASKIARFVKAVLSVLTAVTPDTAGSAFWTSPAK